MAIAVLLSLLSIACLSALCVILFIIYIVKIFQKGPCTHGRIAIKNTLIVMTNELLLLARRRSNRHVNVYSVDIQW